MDNPDTDAMAKILYDVFYLNYRAAYEKKWLRTLRTPSWDQLDNDEKEPWRGIAKFVLALKGADT